jgi:hypothetical protein
MLLSDSVGGADERRKGFSNLMPVNVTARFGIVVILMRAERAEDLLSCYAFRTDR